MGLTPKPNPAWLLDPLHLQQENYLYPYCPCWQTHTLFCFSHTHTGSRVILPHLSLGFDNACLQRHDPLSVAMHHCQQDSSTWFQRTPSQLDPWQWHRHWGGKKKQPVNRTFEHLPANMMWFKCLWIVTVEGFLVSYQNETPHYTFHHSPQRHWFYLTI